MLCVFSVVSDSLIPWTVAGQTPLSIGLPRQEYRSGLPFPPPGSLPDPGFKPASPALQVDFLPLSHWGNQFLMLVSLIQIYHCLYIQNLRLVTGGLEIFLHKLYLEKSLMFRICLALPAGSGGENGSPVQYSFPRIPWTEEPGRYSPWGCRESDTTERLPLPPPGGLGVPGGSVGKESTCNAGDNPWVGKIPWRRARQPTPVFLLENPHGQRSLADYSPCGCKESNTTKMTKNELTSALVLRLSMLTLFHP